MSTAFAVVTAVGAAVSLGLATLGWRARDKPGGRPLVALTLAVAFWDGTFFLASLTPDFAASVALSRLHFVGLTLVVPSLVVLVLEYGGREEWVTRRTVGLLLIEPLAVNLLVWTGRYHDLFVEYGPPSAPDAEPVGSLAVVGAVPTDVGPAFWVHAAYTWVLAAATLVVVVRWALDREALHRRQFGLVAVGIAVPLVASILDNTASLSLRLTEPAFVVTGAVLTVAVVAYDFTEVTPIARRTVFDGMASAVLVVDDRDRLVDRNAAAGALLDLDRSAIGSSLGEALADTPAVAEQIDDLDDGTETVLADGTDGTRSFRVDATTLENARGTVVGRSVLLQDVTAERQRRRELERQNERLERFASLVSHDLRNPLGVAQGHLGLAREGRRESFDTVEDALERMDAIIDDMLALAREGQRVEETEVLDLETVADDAWAGVQTANASFESDLSGRVDGDYSRLRRAFENLFRNAVEHGSKGGQADAATSHPAGDVGGDGHPSRGDGDDFGGVTVRAGVVGGDGPAAGRGFYVEDDGPGIPDEERERVFETGFSEDGTGLGLSIVESIVRAHGWEIRATESDEGGARFEVTGVTGLGRPEEVLADDR